MVALQRAVDVAGHDADIDRDIDTDPGNGQAAAAKERETMDTSTAERKGSMGAEGGLATHVLACSPVQPEPSFLSFSPALPCPSQ